jgi:AAA family ATP:ADP antiporter
MTSLLQRYTQATRAELPAVVWSFLYFFSLLSGYYVLRPIRDEMGLQLGPGVLQELFTWVFLSMLALVPVFGWLTRTFPRRQLLPWLYGFFVVNLLAFSVVFDAGGHQSPLLARVFFVWVSVFNLFVISVFWSFMADLFDTGQARRFYGVISAGGTLGALVGPTLTALLVEPLGPHRLMWVSAGLLALAVVAILRLRAWARAQGATGRTADDGERQALQGGVFSGLVDVVRSPYLLALCAFLLGYTLLSTFLYFLSAELIPKVVTGSLARTRLLAQVDLAVNVLALLLQLLAFKGLIQRLGIRFMLGLLPVVSIVGFAVLALSWPAIAVLVGFGVLRRAGEYALTKPARETLYNVLPPAQKYRAKNVIDTLVHRTGDTASAWLFAGLRGLQLGSAQIAWLSCGLAVGWWAVSQRLGARAQALQAQADAAAQAGARAPAAAPVSSAPC